MDDCRLIEGDCLEALRAMDAGSVHCCVTSPPYWGLRDYGHPGQLGLEPTPEEYVARLVGVLREVRRVLRDDGTLWLNLGDTYHGGGGGNYGDSKSTRTHAQHLTNVRNRIEAPGLKPKDLVGAPWRVAFALQADGWYLRQDIIWAKPNPMPESVRDRCTKAHEYVFLLSKSPRYYYDAEAVAERATGEIRPISKGAASARSLGAAPSGNEGRGVRIGGDARNRRSVWTVTPRPYKGAHFAVMPPGLVEPCVLAGCPEGGVVLDPFAGSGTVLAVASGLGRRAVGVEINPEYVALARKRLAEARGPLFAEAK